MKVFIFNSKNEANEAMQYINNYHGLPSKNKGTSYFGERSYTESTDGKFYINENEFTQCLNSKYQLISTPLTNLF